MSATSIQREKLYRAYMEFVETAERKRNWRIFADIPWEQLDVSKNTAKKATCVETFCAEEMYLPDYASNGLNLTRPVFGLAWFEVQWAYEESKHGLVLREYLTRSGMRTEAEFERFERATLSRSWHLPFTTTREMACYGALQEIATHLAYKAQKEQAEREHDEVLRVIFFLLSRDEAAHAGFYRKVIEFELDEDRQGTIADLAWVVSRFRMPGVGLIPDYEQRLRDGGGGISPRTFLEHGLLPTLRQLETSRLELKRALQSSGRLSSDTSTALAEADSPACQDDPIKVGV